VIHVPTGGARIWFTDRHGGVSRAPYDTRNLGDHVGDEPDAVAENRRGLARELAHEGDGVPADPREWVWLHQVHGADVVTVDAAPAAPPAADAAVTTIVGLPLVVLVADCAPIALTAPGGVAVVHAGWCGLEAGVIERAVAALRDVGGDPVTAVLGPCIHPAHYEFGADLLDRIAAGVGPEVVARTHDGRPALDVPAGVRVALAKVGVDDVIDVGVDTATSPDHYSARHEGTTGRQGVVVVRVA
jgi:YfiH family protein